MCRKPGYHSARAASPYGLPAGRIAPGGRVEAGKGAAQQLQARADAVRRPDHPVRARTAHRARWKGAEGEVPVAPLPQRDQPSGLESSGQIFEEENSAGAQCHLDDIVQCLLKFSHRKFDLWILVRQVDHSVAGMPLATLPPFFSSSLCVLSLRGRDDRAAGLCPRVPAAAGLRPCLPRPSLLARSVPRVVRMD